ncbi:MAG: right-handed parallel beta-helix repeat-containing protein [Candidatus Eisenbacteria bacterium]
MDPIRSRIGDCGVAAFVLGISFGSVFAATIHVPSEQPSLFDALRKARSGDEIVLADGTYQGGGNGRLVVPAIDLDIRSAHGPESVTIRGDDPPAADWFAFHIDGAESHEIRIHGITVQGFDVESGAIVVCGLSRLVLEDCHLVGNRAGLTGVGGAVTACGASQLVLERCVLSGNRATQGGAIATRDGATLAISDCELWGNVADFGGGLHLASLASTVVERSILARNSGVQGTGGAIHLGGGSLRIDQSVLVGNVAGARGGALSMSTNALNARVTSATIAHNVAGVTGGGLYVSRTDAELANTIVQDNCLATPGAGKDITVDLGTMSVECCALDSAGIADLAELTPLGDQVWESARFCWEDDCFTALGFGYRYTLAADSPCLPERSPCSAIIGARAEACDARLGACCVDAACVELPPTECDLRGGTFLGEGLACTAVRCPVSPTVEQSWGRIKALFTAPAAR